MKKHLIALLPVALILSLYGHPRYLVTGEPLSRYEKTARTELKEFYRRMYGEELKEIPETAAAGKPVIFLGRTDFAKKHGIHADGFDREEWELKPVDDDVIIAGGRPVGVLYGVYRMLEQLGVAFLAPDVTSIPQQPDFRIRAERAKPAFIGRVIYTDLPCLMRKQQATPEEFVRYQKWQLRCRFNGLEIAEVPPLYVGRIYNLCQTPQWHTMSQFIHPDLFEKHPEYFAMNPEGVRVKPRSLWKYGDICMSNPEVRKVALESLRKMIRKNRRENPPEDWCIVYDVTRLDAPGLFCQCPGCRKIAEYDGSDTGLLIDFSNYLAREIRKEYPEIIIRIQGHEDKTRKQPNKIIPEKNILFRLCDMFSTRDPFRPIETVRNPEALRYFRNWTRYGTRNVKMLWDYWNLGGTYFTPPRVETVFDTLQPDFRFFLKHRINALFIEAEIDWVCPQNFMQLNYYAASRLLVDPDLDPEVLAEQFIRGYYGTAAAPVMLKYFRLIRDGVRNDPQTPTSAMASLWKFTTPEFLLSMYRDFSAAAGKTAAPRAAARIRAELIAPIWCTLYYWPACEKTFTEAGIRRETLISECRSLVKQYIRRFSSRRPDKIEQIFEERFKTVAELPVRPAKFKNVPAANFRMITSSAFTLPEGHGVSVVKDPDSEQGKALRSASQNPERHGIDRIISPKSNPHKFRTTNFVMSSLDGKIQTFLKKIPTDEKYHWYRIPGRIELKERSNFWGQGWSINARTNYWYTLTYGDAADNTWDQVWFSAKFTGPAYVPNSSSPNAIYVDMAVLTRGEPDREFLPLLTKPDTVADAGSTLPPGWTVSGSPVQASVSGSPDRLKLHLTADAGPVTLNSPAVPCRPTDVLMIQTDHAGSGGTMGIHFLDRDGKLILARKMDLKGASGHREMAADPTTGLELYSRIVSCRFFVTVKKGETISLDNLKITRAEELNRKF